MNALATDAARRLDLLRNQQGFDKDVSAMVAAFLSEIAQRITAVTGATGADGEDGREQHPPPPMTGIWHPYNFLLRFTGEERQALIEAARTDALLEDFRSLCAAAPAIELESPRTVAGMNYLVALNILTPERRDAILDPNL